MNSNIETLKNEILKYNIPKHIAIILDGNGTWAKARGLERNVGHRHGARTLVEVCKYAREIGVEYLTVYAFSTENWNRPKKEVNYLMRLLEVFLREQKKNIKKGNIQLKVIGTRNNLSDRQIKIIESVEEEAKDCTGMHINVAFNYGSYEEIIQAVKRIASDVKNDEITIEDINVELFSNYLYTKGMPAVDLMIRTSGQYRISNFLLWQIAYSELYFPKTLWPDFSPAELNKAIIEYNKRDRRFGGIKCEQES